MITVDIKGSLDDFEKRLEKVIDDQNVDIKCPDCDHNHNIKLKKIKEKPEIVCKKCGRTITIGIEWK